MMLVFDLTDRNSFRNIRYWMSETDNYGSENVRKVLIGNKCDLGMDRQVTYEEAVEFAKTFGLPYFETSAKKWETVAEPFMAVASALVAQRSDLRLEK